MATMSNVQFNELGVSRASHKDILDVTADYVGEKSYSAAKAVYVFIDVLKECGFITEKDKTWHETRHHASLIKLSRSPFDFIKNVNSSRHMFANWWDGRVIETKHFNEKRAARFTDVIRELNECINPVYEACEFLSRAVLYIPKASFETLKGVNGGALCLGMGWNLVDNFQIAATDLSKYEGDARLKKRFEVTQALLKLVSQVSFVALGVMTILSVFFQASFVSTAWVALSAISVVFGILEYYHKNLGTERK